MSSQLIDVAALRAGLGSDRPPVVLDVRWALAGPPGRDLFAEGHVPGAVFVDLDADLADPPGPGGRHPLPDPERFAVAMRRCGVVLDRPVVVCDARDGSVAARAWWLLRHHGHDDVRVLDGGFAAWASSGAPVETGDAPPPFGDDGPADGARFEAAAGRLPVLDADAAAALARDGVLVDARAGARFRGETEPVDPVAGHIPGAVSVPTTELVDADGRMLPADDLLARLAAAGVVPGAAVGAYCGSGVTASFDVLAMAVAGIDAALYPGSWSEWVADPSRPVAVGPGG